MKLLLANDDGIHARGIHALMEVLSAEHELYVVAPNQERSAMGHSLTLHQPILIDKPQLPYPVKAAYSISGTPTDCIKMALTVFFPEITFDAVVSGINHGPNLGGDVFYSGTVSAALEGAFFGIPSIGISLMNGHEKGVSFHDAARWLLGFLQQFPDLPLKKNTALNINFPAVPLAQVAGVRVTHLGKRMYKDTYQCSTDPRGNEYCWLAGELLAGQGDDHEDVAAIVKNWITLTPLRTSLTDEKLATELMALLDTP
jgi:5'-nucleotidase